MRQLAVLLGMYQSIVVPVMLALKPYIHVLHALPSAQDILSSSFLIIS